MLDIKILTAYPEMFPGILEHSLIGKAFLFFYVLSLCYHLFNGIRHIIWDIGFGFEIKNVYYSGIIVIIFAVTLALYILAK